MVELGGSNGSGSGSGGGGGSSSSSIGSIVVVLVAFAEQLPLSRMHTHDSTNRRLAVPAPRLVCWYQY